MGIVVYLLSCVYFTIINESLASTIKKYPYERAAGVENYILPGYEPIRKKCRQLINGAVASTEGSSENIKWRVSRIQKAWELAEVTLDMMLAEKNKNYTQAKILMKRRLEMLNSEDAYFALAPASTDHYEISKPLIRSRQ